MTNSDFTPDIDTSDPLERYLLATRLSATYLQREVAFLLSILAFWMLVSLYLAGQFHHGDPTFYLWNDSSPYRIRAGLEVVPFFATVILGYPISVYKWVRYEAPSKSEIEAMHAAAKHYDSIRENTDV